jgi:DNA repair exonuclease SbcCD ATPase subunit
VTTQLAALQELANARRAELEAAIERARAEWTGLSLDVPASLDALQRRIDELAAAGKLPAGVDRNTLADARETLEALRAKWAGALASFAQGRLPEAADQARESRDRAAELAARLDGTTA